MHAHALLKTPSGGDKGSDPAECSKTNNISICKTEDVGKISQCFHNFTKIKLKCHIP